MRPRSRSDDINNAPHCLWTEQGGDGPSEDLNFFGVENRNGGEVDAAVVWGLDGNTIDHYQKIPLGESPQAGQRPPFSPHRIVKSGERRKGFFQGEVSNPQALGLQGKAGREPIGSRLSIDYYLVEVIDGPIRNHSYLY
ncbi:MAG: hypothetical protein J7L74_03005 [Candidatus Hydrothermae bacterium]|nr:hypothetical protein [Candidatus Hydrothermae bacterium]